MDENSDATDIVQLASFFCVFEKSCKNVEELAGNLYTALLNSLKMCQNLASGVAVLLGNSGEVAVM
jgi:hypothetical protein